MQLNICFYQTSTGVKHRIVNVLKVSLVQRIEGLTGSNTYSLAFACAMKYQDQAPQPKPSGLPPQHLPKVK